MHKTSIRLSAPSNAKLDDLTEFYGSQTRALEAAILTLWYAERGPLVVQRWLMVNDRYGQPHLTTPDTLRRDCAYFDWPLELHLRLDDGEYYVNQHDEPTLRRVIPDHV